MYPILFSIGKVNVYNHGLLMAIGALFGGLVIYFIGRKNNYKTEYVFDLIVFSMLGGLIGSRILYVILYFNQFANVKEMFFIWYGGLVSYGGILGGFLTAWLILKIKKEPILKWFDLGIIGLSIGWVFGRIGCLLNGDSYGLPSSNSIAVWGKLPTQIFESIWMIIVATFCFFLFKKKNKWQLSDGIVFLSGIGLYSLGRFVIDFFRDEILFFWFLKIGQVGSLIVFIFSLTVILLILKRKRGENLC